MKTLKPGLVHPARLPPAIPFAPLVLGRNVIPVLIEVNIAVMLPHIHFKLFRRSLPSPPVVGIAEAEVPLARNETYSAAWHILHIEESEEQPPYMRHVSDALAVPGARRLDRADYLNESNANNEIPGFDRQQEIKQDLAVSVQHPKGCQYAENTTRGSFRSRLRSDPPNSRIGDSNRGERRTGDTKKVKLQELILSPIHLQRCAKPPQAQHVEGDVKDTLMQKRVGDQLPDPPMKDSVRNQRKDEFCPVASVACDCLQNRNAKEDGGIEQDEPFHRSSERGETERKSSVAVHKARRAFGRACEESAYVMNVISSQRSGTGVTAGLRCPAASTALTPKITLSFDIFKVARVALPKLCVCSHSGLDVARQTTS